MKVEIESVIDGLCNLMLANGYTEVRITSYRCQYFSPVIRFCREYNGGFYSEQCMMAYRDMRTEQLERGEITKGHYSVTYVMIQRICSFAETGNANFRKAGKRQYNPSRQGLQVYTEVLEHEAINSLPRQTDAIIRHFFCFLEERSVPINCVTDSVFLDFMSSISELNRGSVKYTRQAMCLISAYMKSQNVPGVKMDFSKVVLKSARNLAIEPFTEDEIHKMIVHAKEDANVGVRDIAIILLGYSTGLRAVDITSMQLSDIDWKGYSVSVIQSKTKESLTLPLNATAMNAVAEYILGKRPICSANEVFLTSRAPYKPLDGSNSLNNIIRKYCRKAGIELKGRRCFHSLRRAFATELSAKQVPLTTISQLLGHTGIDSDKPYLSYNREQIDLCAMSFADIPLKEGLYTGWEEQAI